MNFRGTTGGRRPPRRAGATLIVGAALAVPAWPLALAALATMAAAWVAGMHPARVARPAAWSLPAATTCLEAAALQDRTWKAWARQPAADWRHASLLLIHGHPLPAVLITAPLAVPAGLAAGAGLWAWCCHAYGHGLAHTLANLTLTGYNPKLSNSSFTEKRTLLATSGLSMNQEIAALLCWGRPQIKARAAGLANRIAKEWPGPVDVTGMLDPAWEVAARALAEIPASAWTSYGALAALIGTHPIALGQRLANYPMPNAHRVLQADGRISGNFRWPDGRTDSPRALLESEGVFFDDHDRADPQQCLDVEDLAQLAGLTIDELPEELPELPLLHQDLPLFTEQLAAH